MFFIWLFVVLMPVLLAFFLLVCKFFCLYAPDSRAWRLCDSVLSVVLFGYFLVCVIFAIQNFGATFKWLYLIAIIPAFELLLLGLNLLGKRLTHERKLRFGVLLLVSFVVLICVNFVVALDLI